jgi:hypothetical protein
MNRTGLLAALAVMLTSSPSLGQPPGMGGMGGGMGGIGGGMGGIGGGMGGMGGQGFVPGMVMQGARFGGGGGGVEVQRSARVEMEGGQQLSGRIDLRAVVIDGDLGQYVIAPFKIKVIRFLKPVDEVKPVIEPAETNNREGDGGEKAVVVSEPPQNRAAVRRVSRDGRGAAGGFGNVPTHRAKVITSADKEIVGTIHIPTDFRLELDFGTLALAADKLRSITFTDDHGDAKPAKVGATAPGAPHNLGGPAPDREANLPRYFRQGSFVIVSSPVGDRVTLYSFETKKAESLELSGSKDAPLEVTPILGQNLVALMLKGPKVTRIAVADTASGTWHSQELRKPVEGRAVPIVASGVVVYDLGREVYAYSDEAKSWDVALLPEGIRAMPFVGPGAATIETDGHIYTFTGKTGKWDHVDIRAILDGVAAEKK